MSLFRAEEIAIRFGGIRAVDAVSFDVQQGEVFSIIGPNGAGKTTIFNLISRIYNPTSGELTFDGQNITNGASTISVHRASGIWARARLIPAHPAPTGSSATRQDRARTGRSH